MSRRLSFLSNIFDFDEVDPESRNRFFLVGGITVVVVLALALIFAGYYFDRIASRGDTVFSVGARDFSYAYLEDRVDAALADQPFAASQPETVISQTVSLIQTEELIRLVARDRGISLTPEELDGGLRERVRAEPDLPRNDFARLLRNELVAQGLSLNTYEEIVEAELLREKIRAELDAAVPAEAEQVELSLIQVATEAEAIQARDRILGGEDFGAVATELSKHTSASVGGVVGWLPMGVLSDKLEAAAFSLEPDTLSEVISDTNGFFVLRAAGKEVRPLDTPAREDLVSSEFSTVMTEAQDKHTIMNTLTAQQVQDLADHVRSFAGG